MPSSFLNLNSASFDAFLLASTILAVTPGPGVFYIVTRSLTQGRASGLISVLGVALGNLANVAAAALGLATLFAVSSTALTVVKYSGAIYLLYLGIQTWRFDQTASATPGPPRLPNPFQVFRDAFTVALLNPKTALFFAAYLPQFLSPSKAPLPQTFLFGSIFVLIAATTDCSYALAAGVLQPALARQRTVARIGRKFAGTVYIALGLFTAFASPRAKH